jgi:hypothetical protein
LQIHSCGTETGHILRWFFCTQRDAREVYRNEYPALMHQFDKLNVPRPVSIKCDNPKTMAPLLGPLLGQETSVYSSRKKWHRFNGPYSVVDNRHNLQQRIKDFKDSVEGGLVFIDAEWPVDKIHGADDATISCFGVASLSTNGKHKKALLFRTSLLRSANGEWQASLSCA